MIVLPDEAEILKDAPVSRLPSSGRRSLSPALLLMLVSGFAGLANQMVWTQQFGVWLGHEVVAVLAVVAAFFGGIALGAYTFGHWLRHCARPARWYAVLEVLIALWALLLAFTMPLANAWLAGLTGPHPSVLWQWSIAFLGPFVLLLPATAAMGATLPAIERVTERLRSEGYAIGGLYAANTLGAVLGVLAAVFLLIPVFGLRGTSFICAAMNGLCGLLALFLLNNNQPALPVGRVAPSAMPRRAGIAASLFVTGTLGIGYEVLMVRALSQVAEDTVYTFAILLAVYLMGTAAGAALYQRRLAASSDRFAVRDKLVILLCMAMVMSLLSLWHIDVLRETVSAALGSGFGAAMAGEAAIAIVAFALPTMVMGALFSHLCVQAKGLGWNFGAAIAVNTLGAALAPLLFGVWLLPLLGIKFSLLVLVSAYLMLLAQMTWKRPHAWLPVLAILALAVFSPALSFVDIPKGGRLVDYREGVMAAVSIVEDADGVARLRINNRQQEGSSATGLADARLAYIPLLLHPAPRSVLFLGLGTGVTARAAAEDTTRQVDAVELLPEVVAAAGYFAPAARNSVDAGRANVIVADARRYVRASDKAYDLIVADLFHPARSGASALYSVDHFAAIKARLAPGGLFCQWLPLHQLDLETLRSIVASFMRVYPDATAVLATNSLSTPVLGLIARPDHPHFSRAAINAGLLADAGHDRRIALRLGDEFALLGSFVADAASLRHFTGATSPNTDDRPSVMHSAPYLTYAPDSAPEQRLLALLHALDVRPAALLGTPEDQDARDWQQRLANYWRARSQFIEAGVGIKSDPDPRVMLARVRVPLLAIAALSADFTPAYEPLLGMAAALARIDRAAALMLLAELVRVQPARVEAAQMLVRLQRLSAD